MGLQRHDPHDARRIVFAFVTLVWVPLVAIEIAIFIVSGRFDLIFKDLGVHARLLIALPMYLIAELLFMSRTSVCVSRLYDGRLIALEHGEKLRKLVLLAAGRRDSPAVEIALLLAALGVGQLTFWKGQTSVIGELPTERSAGLVWYGFVSLPVFLFFLYRWLWRWGSWSFLVWKISRLPLRLVPMHPDKAGGLGFLVVPSQSMWLFLFGSSAVIAATFAGRMMMEGEHLASFGPEVLLLLIVGEVLALGPLVAFYGKLISARFSGIEQYGALGIDYDRFFHRRWIESGDTKDLLGTSDIQSLADIQNAYRGLEEMRLAPFGWREMLLIGLSLLLPMLPLLTIEFPIQELIARLLSAIA